MPVGQVVLAVIETKPVEETAEVVCVALIASSGMVIWRIAAGEPKETCCNAETLTSADAAAEPVVAVTNPCNVAGAVAPVSGCRGTAPRFVPFGIFNAVVAL